MNLNEIRKRAARIALDGAFMEGDKVRWSPDGLVEYRALKRELEYEAGLSSPCRALWDLLAEKRSEWFVPRRRRSEESLRSETDFSKLSEYGEVKLKDPMTFGHFMAIHYGIHYDAIELLKQRRDQETAKEMTKVSSNMLSVPKRADGVMGDVLQGLEVIVRAHNPTIGDKELFMTKYRAKEFHNRQKVLKGAADELEAGVRLSKKIPDGLKQFGRAISGPTEG